MSDEKVVSIKNFRPVNDWFYRGGQPQASELEELVKLGIKTVVCLRWNSQAIEEERAKCNELGLRFIYLPLTYWILPKPYEIETFFSIVDNEEMRPLFLHCKHGSDRTGMLVAFFRIARDGWTADQAYLEMKNAGFHKIRMRQFKWAVYGFARNRKP